MFLIKLLYFKKSTHIKGSNFLTSFPCLLVIKYCIWSHVHTQNTAFNSQNLLLHTLNLLRLICHNLVPRFSFSCLTKLFLWLFESKLVFFALYIELDVRSGHQLVALQPGWSTFSSSVVSPAGWEPKLKNGSGGRGRWDVIFMVFHLKYCDQAPNLLL